MYNEMKKTGLTVHDLLSAVLKTDIGKEKTEHSFPYTGEVCRCCYCNFCRQGKCALKKCCCMEERIKAHSCTFTEILHHCFSNINDNIFLYRLRIAIGRANKTKSIFITREHKERFRAACAWTRRRDNNFAAQLYLLTVSETLWKRISRHIYYDHVEYASVWLDELPVNDYALFSIASDLESGTDHTDIEDLSNDEVVDFDIFRAVCHAITICAF